MINNHAGMANAGLSLVNGMGSAMKSLAPTTTKAAESAFKAMGSAVQSTGRGLLGSSSGGHVTAQLGRAASIGSLRVPQTWTTASQPVTAATRALSPARVAVATESESAPLLGGGLPMAPMVPGGGSGTGGVNTALRLQPRAFVMPRNPAAG